MHRKTGLNPPSRYCWPSQGGTFVAVSFVSLCCDELAMRPPLQLSTLLPVVFYDNKIENR